MNLYCHVVNNVIERYNITRPTGHGNIAFTETATDADLARYGYYRVTGERPPEQPNATITGPEYVVSGTVVERRYTIVPFTPTQKTEILTSKRDAIWNDIKIDRENRILQSGVQIDGNWFYSDEPFRGVINQGTRLFALEERSEADPLRAAVRDQLAQLKTSRWKLMDGRFLPPSHVLAVRVDAAHAVLTQACHFNAEVLKAAVYAATDPATVDITKGWPMTYAEYVKQRG